MRQKNNARILVRNDEITKGINAKNERRRWIQNVGVKRNQLLVEIEEDSQP